MEERPHRHDAEPPGPQIELELKLRLDEPSAARLGRSALVRNHRLAPGRTALQVSTYFDTPDRQLEGAGLSLRVRQIGARRVQTLKSARPGAAGRLEWEQDLAGTAPDLVGLMADDGPLAALDLTGGIAPVFTTEIRRTVWRLRAADGSDVELALDRGEIRAGMASQPVCEAELELKSGAATAPYDLARELLAELPFRLGFEAKSDRGHVLAAGRAVAPVRARAVAPQAGESVEAAFKAMARGCLVHAGLNEDPALAGDDVEGIHQLRVALRRLRSAFGLFRPALPPEAVVLNEDLRWMAGELGPARDWDVFLGDVLAPLRKQGDGDADLNRFANVAVSCRARGYGKARAAIGSPRWTDATLRLGRWLAAEWHDPAGALAGEIEPFADAALQRRAKRLRKAGRGIPDLPLDQLHRVRILGKRLRYATEFFRDLYKPRAVRRFAVALARLQEILGVLNDSDVGGRLLDQAAAEAGASASEEWFKRASAMVEGWYAAQMHRELKQLETEWERLADCRRFWSRPPPKEAGDG
jgi:inorganic triphosphatase YgiF